MMKLFLLVLLLAPNGWAAISAATVWELRTLGNASNGGGFVAGASGVDRSQSNTPFCTATDLVLVTATTATSVACPFGATSVGNLIQQTAGTNFTLGFYQVVSVAGVTATLDRAAGTMGATGGTFALGGAIVSPVVAAANLVSGNTVYMKADGTYTTTASAVINATSSLSTGTKFIGYNATRTDEGQATWTTATNSISLIAFTDNGVSIENLILSSTAAARGVGIAITSRPSGATIYNCKLTGFFNAIQSFSETRNLSIIKTEVASSTGDGIITSLTAQIGNVYLQDSYIHNNGDSGVVFNGYNGAMTVVRTISASNATDGFRVGGQNDDTGNQAIYLLSSASVSNGSDGFEYNNNGLNGKIVFVATDSIFYGNTGFGVKSSSVPGFQSENYNGFGANGTDRQNITAGVQDVALSADPFVNKAAGNYALNATAGGGAALKGVGFPGVSLYGTGSLDIGALQSAGGGGGGSASVVGLAQ